MNQPFSYLMYLHCSACGKRHDHSMLQSVCRDCGKSLLAVYDLESARKKITPFQSAGRVNTLWRYSELLPVLNPVSIVSLGEGFTPLLPVGRLGKEKGIPQLWIKEEALNPTGSFKARGLCMAVSKSLELGVKDLCVPTAGNAGGALAAYAAAAGLSAHIYMPADTPVVNVQECKALGADVRLVDGLISDAAKVMNEERGENWFDVSTLKEPYRLEGKKTLGYELAEQFDRELPDVIVYPTGGGTGLIGMWKAFGELEELGWIGGKRPKMVAVQSSGCAPIVRAFEAGAGESAFWEGANTIASGLRVPRAFADSLILSAIGESGGCAIAVSDERILEEIRAVAMHEGILLCPEGAATVAALDELKERGVVDESSRVAVFNTGSGLKYIEVLSRLRLP